MRAVKNKNENEKAFVGVKGPKPLGVHFLLFWGFKTLKIFLNIYNKSELGNLLFIVIVKECFNDIDV
jgi:hypothetical protein